MIAIIIFALVLVTVLLQAVVVAAVKTAIALALVLQLLLADVSDLHILNLFSQSYNYFRVDVVGVAEFLS
jgi:hypothetical protein